MVGISAVVSKSVAAVFFLCLLGCVVLIGVYVRYTEIRVDILKQVTATLLQLLVLGVIGVYIKYLFDRNQDGNREQTVRAVDERRRLELEHDRERSRLELERDRERSRRERETTQRRTLIEQFTSSIALLERAKTLMRATMDLPTYDLVIGRVMDADSKLAQLEAEVLYDKALFVATAQIVKSLEVIRSYLFTLTDEYESLRKLVAQEREPQNVPFRLGNLTRLGDFMQIGHDFRERVTKPYHEAAKTMFAEFSQPSTTPLSTE